MAYETFIPQVWSETLQRELERLHVFAANVNREYEGDVKEIGDSVRILNVGRPTIYETTTAERDTFQYEFNTLTTIENSSISMPITQIRHYRYPVGDIDKAQMMNDGKVMAAYQQETAEGLAQKIDVYLGKTVFPTAPLFTNEFSNATYKYTKIVSGASDTTPAAGDPQNVLEFVDDLIQKLNENDVPDQAQLYLECSPKFWKILKQAYRELDTDNSLLLNGRQLGKYNGVIIKKSNNVKKVAADGGAAEHEYITIHTERAVAYCNPKTHAEAYRPDAGFTDAIKGFTLFDGMITRPKEILCAKITY